MLEKEQTFIIISFITKYFLTNSLKSAFRIHVSGLSVLYSILKLLLYVWHFFFKKLNLTEKAKNYQKKRGI